MTRKSGINPQTKPLEALSEEALKITDGLRIRELISDIGSHTGDPALRSRHLTAIASRFPDASHIVTGTITSMVINRLPGTREFVRGIIDAPLDREKDLIIARAASALLEILPIEDLDVPRIAHTLIRSLPAVRAEVARAISLLPNQHVATLLIQARGCQQTIAMQAFVRKLEEIVTTPSVKLPPRPSTPTNEVAAPPTEPSTKNKESAERPPTPAPPYIKSAERNRHGLPSKTIDTLTSLVIDEVRSLTTTELHSTCATEKDRDRLIAALSECVLREGPASAMQYRNRLVWLASHPLSLHTQQTEFLHALIF